MPVPRAIITANCSRLKGHHWVMWVSDSYEDIAARARRQMERGDLAGALENFKRISSRLAGLKAEVLTRRPELQVLRVLSLAQQAAVHRFQGDFEPALALYQDLGELAPERGSVWRHLRALTYIDIGQIERGLDELRAEAVAAPGNYDVWLSIGVECSGQGRIEEAEENLRRATKHASTPEAQAECHMALFDLYREQGRLDDALAAWNEARQALDEVAEDVFPVYQMFIENAQYDRAAEYLARESNPLRRGFYQGLLEAAQGKADEAEKRWQKVARMVASKYDDGHEAWAEAALRVNAPAENVVEVLGRDWHGQGISSRGLILLAAAEARLGHMEHVEDALTAARNLGLQMRPRLERLSLSGWELFDDLVADPGIKGSVRHFFADGVPGDGQAA
jgi:tetratricopeptide (TPR) repeat protein